MRCGIRNQRGLKGRRYAAHTIDIHEYLSFLPGAKASVNFGETEFNEILLNIFSKIWIRQAYMKGFNCESITIKYVNMFKHMEISESIYEGVA